MQHQLAERTQDQEDEDAADPIHDEKPGPRRRQPAPGAEEQPGADGPAEADHLDLTVREALVVTGLLAGVPVAVRR